MMKRTLCAMMITASLLFASPGPSSAGGPDDGIWSVIETHPVYGSAHFYASVHQNGSTVIFVNVNQVTGGWTFGIGDRPPSTVTVSGTLYQSNGAVYGIFSATLTSDTTFSGYRVGDGLVWSLAGSKMF